MIFGAMDRVVTLTITSYLRTLNNYTHVQQGDDFRITDMKNNTWFRLDAKAFSMSKERRLEDATGQPIATINKKMVSLRTAWVCLSV